MDILKERIRQSGLLLPLALLALGALLRLVCLGSFPPGLNQDEASIGYECWSLLTTGRDRCGSVWPALFTSWGSGQNVLYAWFSLPIVALGGLGVGSLRLASGLCGSISLLLFWRLGCRSGGKERGFWALLALCLNPWHLLLSRWALESNLLPFMLLLGIFFLCLSETRPRCLLLSAAAFGLSLYAYGTAFVVLPFFFLLIALCLLRRRVVKLRLCLAACALFTLIALPVSLCNLRNVLGLPEGRFLWMSLPALTETRQASTMSLSFDNFLRMLQILWKQSDGLIWNSAGPYGLFYGKPGLLAALPGLVLSLRRCLKREGSLQEEAMLCLLGAALLASFFIDGNINRLNALFLPLVWCQALGLQWLGSLLKGRLGPVLVCSLLLAACFLGGYYCTEYRDRLSPAFHGGLCEAIEYAESLGEETLWITDEVNMPYIYVLFCTQTPPEEFWETVEYLNPNGAFRWVRAFGKYRFGGSCPPDTLCILPASGAEAQGEILGFFGNYALVRSKNF